MIAEPLSEEEKAYLDALAERGSCGGRGDYNGPCGGCGTCLTAMFWYARNSLAKVHHVE